MRLHIVYVHKADCSLWHVAKGVLGAAVPPPPKKKFLAIKGLKIPLPHKNVAAWLHAIYSTKMKKDGYFISTVRSSI